MDGKAMDHLEFSQVLRAMKDEDMDALVAFLRTVKPVANVVK